MIDLTQYEVVPHDVISPARAKLRGDIEDRILETVLVHHRPVDVLSWQADHAFSGVSEAGLKHLYTSFDMDVPEPDNNVESVDYEEQLALDLMKRVKPFMEPEAASEALIGRMCDKSPNMLSVEMAEIPDDWILECCSRSDKKKLQASSNPPENRS